MEDDLAAAVGPHSNKVAGWVEKGSIDRFVPAIAARDLSTEHKAQQTVSEPRLKHQHAWLVRQSMPIAAARKLSCELTAATVRLATPPSPSRTSLTLNSGVSAQLNTALLPRTALVIVVPVGDGGGRAVILVVVVVL